MNIAIALILFIVVACLLWGLGELHYKNFTYVEDVPHHPDPTATTGPYVEKGVRDIMRENSTRGYSAVD